MRIGRSLRIPNPVEIQRKTAPYTPDWKPDINRSAGFNTNRFRAIFVPFSPFSAQ